jgi:hypothetical protein
MARRTRPLPAKMRASRGWRRSARPSLKSSASAWASIRASSSVKKTFAYFLNDHHGDAIVSLCVKVVPGENSELIASDPECFYRPAYLGVNGWVGLRLDVDEIDWGEVAAFAANSYRLLAPKRLDAQMESD